MKFYVCGKIGKDNPSPETLAKFKKAEDMLRSRGHEVFNPTTSGLGRHAESLAETTCDHPELQTCDGCPRYIEDEDLCDLEVGL